MNAWHNILIDLAIIIPLIIGIAYFRAPKGARYGNAVAALAVLVAVALVWARHPFVNITVVVLALVAGAGIGLFVAARTNMIKIPAMVALQNGAGGLAAALIAFVELTRAAGGAGTSVVGVVTGYLGLVIGAVTFSGSMIASLKLANKIKQTPLVLKYHNAIFFVILGVIIAMSVMGAVGVMGVMAGDVSPRGLVWGLVAVLVSAMVLGEIFAIRIGGADMPVLISFLNSMSGLAAAFCGIILQNRLLVVFGSTVGASGLILTHAMCRAMNRKLINVFVSADQGGARPAREGVAASKPAADAAADPAAAGDPLTRALDAIRAAKSVIVIPGYGMALAHAQFEVVQLVQRLVKMGKSVKYAIHPVAGRMPGHMNVVLAEADVDYDQLCEMDAVNPEFPDTDVALIVGACDVVNPAAIQTEGTPISGMPILMAQEAKHSVVCNLDAKPGYSGVENPLYQNSNTIMLLGNAKDTVAQLLAGCAQ